MPTLDLITPTPHPGASHRVLAPGGYEGWHFDAVSDDGSLHLIAGLHEADSLDDRYARAYSRYRRRPTRVAPPLPADFPAVAFALFQHQRPLAQFVLSGAQAGESSVSTDGGQVRVGACHAIRTGERGGILLNLRGTDSNRTIAVNLTYRPTFRADCEMTVMDAADGRGLHRWICAEPLCDVDGEIAIFDGSGGAPSLIPFAGTGGHDHLYGTRPIADVSKAWLIGRAMFEDRVIVFLHADGERAHVLTTGQGIPVESAAMEITADRPGAPNRKRGHPDRVRIGDLDLQYPQIAGLLEDEILLTYSARSGPHSGIALCRLIHPPVRRQWHI